MDPCSKFWPVSVSSVVGEGDQVVISDVQMCVFTVFTTCKGADASLRPFFLLSVYPSVRAKLMAKNGKYHLFLLTLGGPLCTRLSTSCRHRSALIDIGWHHKFFLNYIMDSGGWAVIGCGFSASQLGRVNEQYQSWRIFFSSIEFL